MDPDLGRCRNLRDRGGWVRPHGEVARDAEGKRAMSEESPLSYTWWWEQSFSLGVVEHEVLVTVRGEKYTGWHRCKNGRLADGRHPEWKDALARYRLPDGSVTEPEPRLPAVDE